MGVSMGSVEIAMITADMDVEMDAENGDVLDAKTTDEMTNGRVAEVLEIETRVPPMDGEVPPHHLDSPRVRVTRTKSAGS